jgi:DNA polymerase III epsilon subunit-like protein
MGQGTGSKGGPEMKINVVDIETTGFSPNVDLIVEIGIALLDTDSGNIQILFDQIIHESGFGPEHQSAWVFANSDLSHAEVLKAEPLDRFREEIQNILNKHRSTAFNSDFDFRFLEYRKFDISNKAPCIMKSCTPIVRLPGYYGKNKWPKVEEAWAFFFPDEDYTEQHRAADDAAHEARILLEMIRRIGKYATSD